MAPAFPHRRDGGLAGHIRALVRGILWDRIGASGPVFEVAELHRDRLRWCRIQAGRSAAEEGPDTPVADGVLAEEPEFRLRAVTLDHGTPVLAFAFEPTPKLSVDKARLAALQISKK